MSTSHKQGGSHKLFKRIVFATLAVALTTAIAVNLTDSPARADTATMVPDADITAEFVTLTGTNDGTCGGIQHCNYVDEGVTPNITDYISNDTAVATNTEEFSLTSPTVTSTASQLIVTVHAQSASNANGGTLDTLDINVRINGVLQTATVCTPAFASWGNCTATYSGTWTQADVDSMQINIVKTTLGGGNQTARRDIIDIAAVSAELTYAAPPANVAPAAPTLIAPVNLATGVSTLPSFQLRTTDTDNDYLRYRINLYEADCTTLVGTFNQNANQNGWSGQDTQGGTAYIGSNTLAGSTIATYTQQITLAPATTYCWQAAAIDPAGSATYGSNSATSTFTTAAAAPPPDGMTDVELGGELELGGGTVLGN